MSYSSTSSAQRQYIDLTGQFRTTRRELNLTQAQLAKLTGTSQSVIANLESGRGNPTLHTLLSIAEALGLQIEVSQYPYDR